MPRTIMRTLRWSLLVVLAVSAAVLVTLRARLHASLPMESGVQALTALSAEVRVERDALGVPALRSDTEDFADIACALGFVHAQERFWQMDTLRRRAAGELSELVGAAGLDADRQVRGYAFREVARGVLPKLPEHHRRWLESYTVGVNAGLGALGSAPPEYWLLWTTPEPWAPEDCVLAALAMHETLSFGEDFEWRYDAISHGMGKEIADFLMPETSRWDTPMLGDAGDPTGLSAVPDLPAAEPESAEHAGQTRAPAPTPVPAGSNNWAIAGAKSRDGRAILANDMHLKLMVPATWYRVQLEWKEAGETRRAVGVTLPGVPGLVVGSSGRLAWGFTNVTGDFEDYVEIEVDASGTLYRAGPGPDDWLPFEQVSLRTEVRWGKADVEEVKRTKWGPIVRESAGGKPLALRWAALDSASVNLGILDMLWAKTLEDGVKVARRWWGPPQNVAIASSDGRVGWVVSGWIPARRGFDGRAPATWASPGTGWTGPIDEAQRPTLIDPPGGVIFSANARTLPVEQARLIGRCWSSGERQRRIAEVLRQGSNLTESDMLALQLDTRTEMMDFYRELVLECVPADEANDLLRRARQVAEAWNGRADADQPGLGVLAVFRRELMEELISKRVRRIKGATYWWFQDEEPLRRLLEERPNSWLHSGDENWPALMRRVLLCGLERRYPEGRTRPPEMPWGQRNAASIRHGLSLAAPLLGRWLDMPRDPQSGHDTAVRVQGRGFGASERMVVSPGREEDGILHIPCGQSGHFLSRHYRDSHAAWVEGEATPLLAGPARSVLRLVPAR